MLFSLVPTIIPERGTRPYFLKALVHFQAENSLFQIVLFKLKIRRLKILVSVVRFRPWAPLTYWF